MKKFAFIIPPFLEILDLAGPIQVFTEARFYGFELALQYYSYEDQVTCTSGLPFSNIRNYNEASLGEGDYLFIPRMDFNYVSSFEFKTQRKFFNWIKTCADNKVYVCSICYGAFALGHAGLLKDTECTTHWRRIEALQAEFSTAKVISDILFKKSNNIYTSAGISAGIDLSLEILEELKGALFTHKVARGLVVYHRRSHNHTQKSIYLDYRNHINPSIHIVQDHLIDHLSDDNSIEELASLVLMSARNLSRVFKEKTGTTILEYLTMLRLEYAKTMINNPEFTIEYIASKCGFKTARQLQRILKTNNKKMRNKTILKSAVVVASISVLLFNACQPLREFGTMPAYEGTNSFSYATPSYDSTKKTVVIVANNVGTELFDMMAPYYLFNATEKANVYIVAKSKIPIVVKKGFYILPQNTFSGIDESGIKPDVIVIPFLSADDSIHQDPVIVNWIRSHYTPSTSILAICDGAATAAATGFFDGKPITAHASDYDGIRTFFSKPIWKKNAGVVNSGNLYSTAGVSNATDGSLMVINKIFGTETMNKVRENISYPYRLPRTEHQSNTFAFSNKVSIGRKIFFSSNKKLGFLLKDGMNEFELAAVMDTYKRTFPKSIESFSKDDQAIETKYGLTLIPTDKINNANLEELHVVSSLSSAQDHAVLKSAKVVMYDNGQKQYIINDCLQRISAEYGHGFEKVVKLMLDYN